MKPDIAPQALLDTIDADTMLREGQDWAAINTGTANQFLNNRGTTPEEYGYAVFGRVIDGMDVVDQIENVATGRRGAYSDVPTTPVEIVSITLQ